MNITQLSEVANKVFRNRDNVAKREADKRMRQKVTGGGTPTKHQPKKDCGADEESDAVSWDALKGSMCLLQDGALEK